MTFDDVFPEIDDLFEKLLLALKTGNDKDSISMYSNDILESVNDLISTVESFM